MRGGGSTRCWPSAGCSRRAAARPRPVLAGEVRIGARRRRAAKPGQLVTEDVELEVDEAPRYVSRGGIKLANALDGEASTWPAGAASTSAPRPAASPIACCGRRRARGRARRRLRRADWRLRADPRVTVIERFNARSLAPDALPYAPDLLVADVSFISLRLILPAAPRVRRRPASTRSRWSSRSSRSAAGSSAGAASCASPRCAARALLDVGGRGGRARRRGPSASRLRACPGRRATSRRSSWLAEPGRGVARRPRIARA